MPATNDAITGDPFITPHFEVVVGKISGYFTEVSGLGSESEVIEHKIMSKGAKDPVVRKVPGRLKWTDLTLKRGITKNMDFYDWRKQVEQGDIDGARLNGSLIMYDQAKNPVAQWDFEAAWPSKVTGPQFQADGNAIGIEEIVLVFEQIKRIK